MLYFVVDTIDNAGTVAELQLGEKTATKRQIGITNFFRKADSNPKRSLSPSLQHAGKKLRTKVDLQPVQPPSKMPWICMTCFKYVN
jgi:hypothetical protein